MKRIITALAVTLGLLVPVGVTAVTIAPPAAAVSCDNSQQRQTSLTWNNPPQAASGFSADFVQTVTFKQCVDALRELYVAVTAFNVRMRTNGVFCAQLENFRANPNVIGNWNPGAKTWPNCRTIGGSWEYLYWNKTSPPARVNYDDPSSARCIAAVITIDPGEYTSPPSRTLPTICVA